MDMNEQTDMATEARAKVSIFPLQTQLKRQDTQLKISLRRVRFLVISNSILTANMDTTGTVL